MSRPERFTWVAGDVVVAPSLEDQRLHLTLAYRGEAESGPAVEWLIGEGHLKRRDLTLTASGAELLNDLLERTEK